MTTKLLLLASVMLATISAFAQSSAAYRFKTVLRPETVIEGHAFFRDEVLSAAVNDGGEVAFVASAQSGGDHHAYTLHRLVATHGDHIDSQQIRFTPSYQIAINNKGVVAFEARISPYASGIFVEHKLVKQVSFLPADFTLNDDDTIIVDESKPACTGLLAAGKEALGDCGLLSVFPHSQNGLVVITRNTPQGPFLIVGKPKKH